MSPTPTAAAKLEEPSTSSLSKMFRSPEKRTVLCALLLVAAVFAAYSAVTQNGFLNYDDDTYITINPHVQAGLTRSTIRWAFTTFYAANYHPLTWLSHALDCELYGLDPSAHHQGNVLLHAANAVLLFLFLQRATGFPWRSLFVAALFALHPINVESVAWAAERKNVLSMLFFLLALHAYIGYTRRPGVLRYAPIVLLFACALLSKPQVITFSFLLLLLDYWPLNRWSAARIKESPARKTSDEAELVADQSTPAPIPSSFGWLVLEKIPLFALSAASAIVTMKAQQAGGAIQTLILYSPLLRVETAVIAYVRYLDKAFWPAHLVVLYPHPTQLYPVWQVAAAALLLAIITIAVVRARARRYLLVGWLWFLGSLVPMIGLVQVGAQAIADRYAYIPFIGLFLMFTWLTAEIFEAHSLHAVAAPTRRTRTSWLAAPALVILLVLSVLTHRQVGYWHDVASFWTRTINLTENNYIAHDTLGEYLSDQGQTDEAAVQFRAALAIRPDDLPANLNLGTYDHAHGNLPSAIARYWIVALRAADPSLRAAAYGNLGSAYRQIGDFPDARKCFETSLALVPGRSMPMIGLGLIAQKNGDLPEAIRQYTEAMQVEPTDVGYLLMADALQQEGKSEEAEALRKRVAQLSPNLSAAEKQAQGLLTGK